VADFARVQHSVKNSFADQTASFRIAFSLAARFGVRPTQTRSLLFLIPLRTILMLLVSTPTVCANELATERITCEVWS